MPLVNPITAAFAAAYAKAPGPPPLCAASEAMFTIAPRDFAIMRGAAAWVQKNAEVTLRSSTCRKSDSDISESALRSTRSRRC
jgi:hypothetical protein